MEDEHVTFQYPPLGPIRDGAGADVETGVESVFDRAWAGPLVAFMSVPFCVKRCHGCPYFIAFAPRNDDGAQVSAYARTVVEQIRGIGSRPRYGSATMCALYVGGGTGSLLSITALNSVVDAFDRVFGFASDAEITLEGNPREFAKPGYLVEAVDAGVTRVSVGYQSPVAGVLDQLNSPHDTGEGTRAIGLAVAAGFNTVNVDVMYAVPGQNEEMFNRALEEVLGFGVNGITLYEYRIPRGTPAARLAATARLAPRVDKTVAHTWYLAAALRLTAHGYVEFRKGSFARPGHRQRYGELAYGGGAELLGVGAGAYGYIGGRQYQLIRDPAAFADAITAGRALPLERLSVQATPRMERERFVVLNLLAGRVDEDHFRQRFHASIIDEFGAQIADLEETGLASLDSAGLVLTDRGLQHRATVQRQFFATEFLR
jgi:coproporphyrinogen III oxidase-like Fe-S oxidoreductase